MKRSEIKTPVGPLAIVEYQPDQWDSMWLVGGLFRSSAVTAGGPYYPNRRAAIAASLHLIRIWGSADPFDLYCAYRQLLGEDQPQ